MLIAYVVSSSRFYKLSNDILVRVVLIKHSLMITIFSDLPSHPQYQLALKQSTGHSGIVSFYIKGNAKKFLKSLKLFALAESLGGYESLAELP